MIDVYRYVIATPNTGPPSQRGAMSLTPDERPHYFVSANAAYAYQRSYRLPTALVVVPVRMT